MSLAEKLFNAGKELGHLEKDSTNTHFRYKYVSHAAVTQAVYKQLEANNIAITASDSQLVHVVEGGKNVVVRVLAELTDLDSGESKTFAGLGQGSDTGDKAVMKANTAAHKYLWQVAFGLSWGDDPEGSESYEEATAKKKPAAKKRASRKKEQPKVTSTCEDILAALESAKTRKELNAARDTAIAFVATNPESEEKLISAFQNKKKELGEE